MTNKQFSDVVEQYQRLVYTICYQMVQDHFEAQNLAQETFLSAYTHIDRCDPNELKPWLARIASNKARDYLKSAYARKVQLDSGEDSPERPAPPGTGPEDRILVREGVEKIRQAVLSLNEPYRKVSVLYFLEEKGTDEIAKALGRPQKTVQTQIYRARQQLRKVLKEGDRDG